MKSIGTKVTVGTRCPVGEVCSERVPGHRGIRSVRECPEQERQRKPLVRSARSRLGVVAPYLLTHEAAAKTSGPSAKVRIASTTGSQFNSFLFNVPPA